MIPNNLNKSEEIEKTITEPEQAGSERSVVKKTEARHAAPEPDKPGAFALIKSFAVDVIIALCLAMILLHFIRPTIVKQTSMENTLHENDYMIMSRQAYKDHGPERGDIVIFQSELPNDDGKAGNKLLIKRVIGLPGDVLEIKDDQLYINGEAYHEDYIRDGYTPAVEVPAEGESFTVPENSYFCMGDNRGGSIDSRYNSVGCITPDLIIGKVVLRLFPFNKIQRF